VELEILRGRLEEARRVAERALEMSADDEYVFYTARLYAIAARAEAAIAERARAQGDETGSDDAARRARGLSDRIHRLLGGDHWIGTPPPESLVYGEVCAAEAERAAGAPDATRWQGIAERWAELRLRLDEAYAHHRRAECLAIDGERAPAADAVSSGLRIARDAGARVRSRTRSSRWRGAPGWTSPMPARTERVRVTQSSASD
jgi:tetratricopeptide (TPR) repeat protein